LGQQSWLSSKGISPPQMFLTPQITTFLGEEEAAVPSKCCISQGVSHSAVDQHLMLKPLQAICDSGAQAWQPKIPNSATGKPNTGPNH